MMNNLKKILCLVLALLMLTLTACTTDTGRKDVERSRVSGKIAGSEITFGVQTFSASAEKLTLNLQVRSNEILDLSVLSKCTQLRRLTINVTVIPHIGYDKFNDPFIVEQEPVDLTPVSALPVLERLELNVGRIADLSVLARLPKLNSLVIWIDGEVDLAQLSACLQLTDLALGGRGTVDLSPVRTLPLLKSLRVDVYDDQWNAPDLSVLSGAPHLETLSVGASRGLRDLTDVPLVKLIDINDTGEILENLPETETLEYLEFSDENISDISPLLTRKHHISKIVLEVGAQDIENYSVIESAADPLLDQLITSIPVGQLRTILSWGDVTIILRVDQNRSVDGTES